MADQAHRRRQRRSWGSSVRSGSQDAAETTANRLSVADTIRRFIDHYSAKGETARPTETVFGAEDLIADKAFKFHTQGCGRSCPQGRGSWQRRRQQRRYPRRYPRAP